MELVVCKSRVKADRKNVVGAVCNVQSGADESECHRIDQMLCFVAEGAFRFHAPASHPPDCIVESGGWPKACAIRLEYKDTRNGQLESTARIPLSPVRRRRVPAQTRS